MKLYTGVVENRADPLKLGRCQVRIVGLHTEQKTLLPTNDLPWAFPMQPVTSAAMNGIGHAPIGPVEGTWVIIFFRDLDEQQPIMMGTIGGIPQLESKKIDEFTDAVELFPSSIASEGSKSVDVTQNIVTDSSGNSIATGSGGVLTTGNADNVSQAATTSKQTAEDAKVDVAIPGNPPYNKKVGNSSVIPQASYKGIQALGVAMTTAGITSRYARAAILGIAMGESKCIPQNEGFKYSKGRLKQVFSWIDDANAETYANWGGSREDFFRYIYGPTTRSGKSLGHTSADDGAKYWGRGYIQLTGKGNYTKYAKLSKVDIIKSPELINDYEQGALVAVSYFKDRVKISQKDPGYFDAACKAVGYNVPDIKATKKAFYEYFLGEESTEDDKSAMPGEVPSTVEVNEQGIPKDRVQNLVTGFSDPQMKYPLRTHINEPDTNRLARSKIEGTAVQKKDNARVTAVPVADGTTFSQPIVPYNGSYPYNHVFESESGHIQEFDDTPLNERIHLYHKTGSFLEIDCNGTQVNRIVGNGYQIIDKNGYIYISGACTITAEGTTNIFVNADANIKVAGLTQIDLLNDAAINVAGNLDLNVGGSFQVKCADFTLETTADSVDISSVTGVNIQGKTAINVKSDAEVNIQGKGNINAKSAGAVNMQGGGNVSLKAGGNVVADGAIIDLANGSSSDAGAAEDAAKTDLGIPPVTGSPENNSFPDLETPPRQMEETSAHETPEEVATVSGQADKKSKELNATKDLEEPVVIESVKPATPTIPPKGASCSAIFNMEEFPAVFKITPNITYGQCNDMGRSFPKHKLQNQVGLTPQQIMCNLKGVAENCMEPIFELAGGRNNIIISSGYRQAQNSADLSQHCRGEAMDFQLTKKMNDPQALYDFALEAAKIITFDQMILEYQRGTRFVCWIHVSFSYKTNRKHTFTMIDHKRTGPYPGPFKLITA
jgi:predicted chitinase